MGFEIPNVVNPASERERLQAMPDSVDFDALARAYGTSGVKTDCLVAPQTVPNMTVKVNAGEVFINGERFQIAQKNQAIAAADATFPRFDLIVASPTGVDVVTGLAVDPADVPGPVFPALPFEAVMLAAVYVPAAATSITADYITDKRIVVRSWPASAVPYGDSTVEDALDVLASPTVAGLEEPVYVPHRGGALVYPENTMEALRAVLAAGAPCIEFDVWDALDGLVIMHDSTTDRTTTSSGSVFDHSVASWQQLVVDAGTFLGGTWGNLKAPLFADILREFGGKTVLVPQPKTSAAVLAVTEAVVEAKIEKSVLMQTILSRVAAPIAAGIPVMVVQDNVDPAAAVAAGVDYVAVSTAATDLYVASLLAAGLKVMVYTIDRQSDRDTWLAKGAIGIISDNPIYVMGDTDKYRLDSDPFATQNFYHGQLKGGSNRGVFKGTDRFGWDGSTSKQSSLLGFLGPVADPENYTIDFDLTYDAISATTTLWGSIFFGASDDRAFLDAGASSGMDGYHLIWRQNLGATLFRVDDGVGTAIGSSIATGTPVIAGQVRKCRVTVTPTQITFTDVDRGLSVTVTDSTYRGDAAPHILQQNSSGGALAVSFSNVVKT